MWPLLTSPISPWHLTQHLQPLTSYTAIHVPALARGSINSSIPFGMPLIESQVYPSSGRRKGSWRSPSSSKHTCRPSFLISSSAMFSAILTTPSMRLWGTGGSPGSGIYLWRSSRSCREFSLKQVELMSAMQSGLFLGAWSKWAACKTWRHVHYNSYALSIFISL